MHPRDPLQLLLASGLDLGRPFTTRQAREGGLDARRLRTAVEANLLSRPLRGVFVATHLPDTLELRVECVRLVVPPDGVVTDRTAGWLHGTDMVLAPNDHLVVPAMSVFQSPGKRLRNDVTASGERRLRRRDVMDLSGVRLTTPLRTACDLGRFLQRDAALAAMDAMMRVGGFSLDELLTETSRFKGYRGVRQLRALAPLVDLGSESFGESALRLRWYDAGGLPRPETQIFVELPNLLTHARLDIGSRELQYAAEYDGAAFHGPDRAEHDAVRRESLRSEGWIVSVFTKDDVFGRQQRAESILRRESRPAALRVMTTRAG